MEKILVKMKVAQTSDFGNNNCEARLVAVTKECEENKTFAAFMPVKADAFLLVNNPDKINFFKAGEEVFLTITKHRPVYTQYQDLLSYCLDVLKNPGKYNNDELHNLRASIGILLDEDNDEVLPALIYKELYINLFNNGKKNGIGILRCLPLSHNQLLSVAKKLDRELDCKVSFKEADEQENSEFVRYLFKSINPSK